MIELILADRCTGCGDCVAACPTNVFEPGPGGVPVIARQADCQTCFMCELYCRTDALFVGPDCEQPAPVDAAEVQRAGWVGQFRRHSGWHEWTGQYPNDHWRMDEVFRRARDLA